jgi:probable rRNA maturation factor
MPKQVRHDAELVILNSLPLHGNDKTVSGSRYGGEFVMLAVNILESDEVDGLLTIEPIRLEEYARDVLVKSGITAGEFNIVFIGDEYMSELNRIYKDRQGTTDVLSFNLGDDSQDHFEGVNGEVYVSLERASMQSGELETPFEEEVVRLVTHGLLHITGRVHDTDKEYAAIIEDTEKLVKSFFAAGSGK